MWVEPPISVAVTNNDKVWWSATTGFSSWMKYV